MEAKPVFTPGASLSRPSSLLVLPALEVTGRIDAAKQARPKMSVAFRALSTTALTMVFFAIEREPQVEE